jgi:superfamily II DNA or RNA helicase
MNLRPYQTDVINKLKRKILSGSKSILIVMPTGAGKTVVAASIIHDCVAKHNTVIFAVPRIELARQSIDTIDVPCGKIIAGDKMDLTLPAQVANILTLRSRHLKIPAPTILIIDEAHRSSCRTWRETIDYYRQQGTLILGLSATPIRMDKSSLSDVFDDMVVGPSIRELIDQGSLSDYKYFAPDIGIDTSKIKIQCGDFNGKELEFVVNQNKITGDAIEHYKRMIPGKKAIVFCVSVEHAKKVAEQFSAAGIPAAFVEGGMSDESRKDALRDFSEGRLKILCNVMLLTEGIDVCSVEAVIMLRPTMSLSLDLQMIGRALRVDKANPDKVAYILDHVNNVRRHGLPDQEREWTLEGKTKTRKSEASTVAIRMCPNCYMVIKPAEKCPYCDYEFRLTARELAIENGELKKYDAEQERKVKLTKKIELWSCKTRNDLETLAKERGYNPYWVNRQMRLRHIKE